MKTYADLEKAGRFLSQKYGFQIETISQNNALILRITDKQGYLVKDLFIGSAEETISNLTFKTELIPINQHGKIVDK